MNNPTHLALPADKEQSSLLGEPPVASFNQIRTSWAFGKSLLGLPDVCLRSGKSKTGAKSEKSNGVLNAKTSGSECKKDYCYKASCSNSKATSESKRDSRGNIIQDRCN